MRSTCGRPNRTAAAGTLWGARLRPWAMEEIGGDRWSRLGEVRRAAVKCQTAQPRLAQGPDGTVGFALRRTNGRTRVWNVGGKMGLGVLMAHGLAFARYRAGEMVLISTVAAFCLFGMAPFLSIREATVGGTLPSPSKSLIEEKENRKTGLARQSAAYTCMATISD